MTSNSFALDITPSALYTATKEACAEVSRLELKSTALDKINAGYFPTRKYSEIMTFIRSESFNKVLSKLDFSENLIATHILGQPEFHQALAECAGNNWVLKSVFIDSVNKSDRAGKILGTFMVIVSFRGWAALLKTLPQKWATYSGTIYKFLLGIMGTHLIRGDTEQTQSVVFKPNQQKDQESSDKNRYQQMKVSLSNQIRAEENKILSCGLCPAKETFEANRRGLIELLEIVEKNSIE